MKTDDICGRCWWNLWSGYKHDEIGNNHDQEWEKHKLWQKDLVLDSWMRQLATGPRATSECMNHTAIMLPDQLRVIPSCLCGYKPEKQDLLCSLTVQPLLPSQRTSMTKTVTSGLTGPLICSLHSRRQNWAMSHPLFQTMFSCSPVHRGRPNHLCPVQTTCQPLCHAAGPWCRSLPSHTARLLKMWGPQVLDCRNPWSQHWGSALTPAGNYH